MHGYGDASWATPPDRKSTTGYIWLLNGGPVSWKSVKQSIVAMSTCEAEYVASGEATKEMAWLTGLANDLEWKAERPILYCDNQAAIATAISAATSERSKHIDVRHHYIRGVIEREEMQLEFCGTQVMLADALTKVSTRNAIEKFQVNGMNILNQYPMLKQLPNPI